MLYRFGIRTKARKLVTIHIEAKTEREAIERFKRVRNDYLELRSAPRATATAKALAKPKIVAYPIPQPAVFTERQIGALIRNYIGEAQFLQSWRSPIPQPKSKGTNQ
jgi:hypothetical protein